MIAAPPCLLEGPQTSGRVALQIERRTPVRIVEPFAERASTAIALSGSMTPWGVAWRHRGQAHE